MDKKMKRYYFLMCITAPGKTKREAYHTAVDALFEWPGDPPKKRNPKILDAMKAWRNDTNPSKVIPLDGYIDKEGEEPI